MAIGAGLVGFQGKSGPPVNLYVGPLMVNPIVGLICDWLIPRTIIMERSLEDRP